MSKVAEAVAQRMRSEECFTAMWLDGWVLDAAGGMVSVKIPHPLNRMRAIFAHLERSPMFEKRYIRGMDSRGRNKVVRGFLLKPEFRNAQIQEGCQT